MSISSRKTVNGRIAVLHVRYIKANLKKFLQTPMDTTAVSSTATLSSDREPVGKGLRRWPCDATSTTPSAMTELAAIASARVSDPRLHALLEEWEIPEEQRAKLNRESIWSCTNELERRERIGLIKYLTALGVGPQPIRQKIATNLAKALRSGSLGKITPPAWEYVPPLPGSQQACDSSSPPASSSKRPPAVAVLPARAQARSPLAKPASSPTKPASPAARRPQSEFVERKRSEARERAASELPPPPLPPPPHDVVAVARSPPVSPSGKRYAGAHFDEWPDVPPSLDPRSKAMAHLEEASLPTGAAVPSTLSPRAVFSSLLGRLTGRAPTARYSSVSDAAAAQQGPGAA